MESTNKQPFYVGERVIAVDALPGSLIKNGRIYTILSCDYRYCGNGNSFYWYVGVEGSHNSLRPSIFAPLNPPKMMSFERITENIHVN